MAIQVTRQVLYEGRLACTMQFTGYGDGNDPSGQLNNFVLADVTEMVPQPSLLSISFLNYNVSGGGSLTLLWDAVDPVPFLILTEMDEIDYSGIRWMNNGGGDTATGNILGSTSGFDAGSSFSLRLDMRKKGLV